MRKRTITVTMTALLAGLVSVAAQAGEPVSIFDGKTLDGWDVTGCEAVVQDGAILLKSGNGLVQAKKKYADFVLEYEWKALRNENYDSGIYFRYSEVPAGRPWPKRYQVNLRHDMMGDLGGFPDGKNKVPTKLGEWNKFELTVKGTKASLKVNGTDSWSVDGVEEGGSLLSIQAEVPGGGQFLFRSIRITDLKSE